MTGKAKSTLGQLTQGARPKKRTPLKVGRVTKLTPEVSKRICDAIRAGNFISVAARYAGVSEFTVHDWIKRGRGEHPERQASRVYVQFAHDVEEAEAHAEVAAVLHWRSAMPKDWRSASKWLETRYADRWAEKPPDQRLSTAFAGVQVNIGGSNAQIGPNGVQNTLPAPISELLEENPALIAPTMQILDQFLPNNANEAQTAEIAPTTRLEDVTEAEYTELASESASEGPFAGLNRFSSANEDETHSETLTDDE